MGFSVESSSYDSSKSWIPASTWGGIGQTGVVMNWVFQGMTYSDKYGWGNGRFDIAMAGASLTSASFYKTYRLIGGYLSHASASGTDPQYVDSNWGTCNDADVDTVMFYGRTWNVQEDGWGAGNFHICLKGIIVS